MDEDDYAHLLQSSNRQCPLAVLTLALRACVISSCGTRSKAQIAFISDDYYNVNSECIRNPESFGCEENLEERIISHLAEIKHISLEKAMDLYYNSDLSGKIHQGLHGIQYLDYSEELAVEIRVGDLIRTIEYDYPEFHLSMDCFLADIKSGQLEIEEAAEARWLTPDAFDEVEWLPADLELLEELV